jgi:CheY-like chemotaxis protein
MSRIVSGKVTLETAPIDLNELVAEVCNSQRPAAEAKGLTLRLQVASQPALVLGDHTRLQQVVWNLLTNAIKFTPSGGRVQVSVAQRDERIEIIVNDTGEGIVPDFIEHVFGRFRQAEGGAARRHGGLGLGLAIVKQLVELHGGNVDAESPGPGKGSTFTVRLPQLLVPSLDKLEATGAWQTPGESLAQNSLAGLTVLAVEDQPDMLEYLRRVLEEHGARVIAATSGAEALDAVRNAWVDGGVDLFVSDLGLPGMDGYELIRHVREVLGLGPADLPAVAVTAFARSEDRKRALDAGFQAHLSKPYQVAQLVSVLNAVCKRDDASSGGTRH